MGCKLDAEFMNKLAESITSNNLFYKGINLSVETE